MSISVNPAVPIVAPQGAAPEQVLQPGTVVQAQVVKLLANNLVQIAISNLSLEVISAVPLQVGQSLQLAVTQTQDGVRLAVVGQGGNAGGAATDAAAGSAGNVPAVPNTPAVTPPGTPVAAAPSTDALTAVERQAVVTATQVAAPQQASLAPLFANLGAIVTSTALPPQLQQAIVGVLAQRTSLDPDLDGNDIRNAVQKSGLFFEATLASGSALPVAGVPDLKAALIVLRQTLSSLATSAQAGQGPATPAPSTPGSVVVQTAAAPVTETAPAAVAAAPDEAAPSGEVIAAQSSTLPVAGSAADDFWQSAAAGRIAAAAVLPEGAPTAIRASAALTLLQEVSQTVPSQLGSAVAPFGVAGKTGNVEPAVRTDAPPPFRGALPSAQPVASPSILPEAPLAATVRHLLDDTDAAIARQTLLQAASLPDRSDSGLARDDFVTPKWNFEIPFATPMGTAMAQFEISRDGGGNEVEAAKKAWRARFSIDIEPAGPVHALVTLSGDKTSVRMWAERPATATQLRAGRHRAWAGAEPCRSKARRYRDPARAHRCNRRLR